MNFIPHETIICDDRGPPWINNRIKKIIYEQNSLYKDCCKNNDTQIFTISRMDTAEIELGGKEKLKILI